MKLSDRILRHKEATPYQLIAKEVGVSSKFVGMIARGERIPKRGKGMDVKKLLEDIANSLNK